MTELPRFELVTNPASTTRNRSPLTPVAFGELAVWSMMERPNLEHNNGLSSRWYCIAPRFGLSQRRPRAPIFLARDS